MALIKYQWEDGHDFSINSECIPPKGATVNFGLGEINLSSKVIGNPTFSYKLISGKFILTEVVVLLEGKLAENEKEALEHSDPQKDKSQ